MTKIFDRGFAGRFVVDIADEFAYDGIKRIVARIRGGEPTGGDSIERLAFLKQHISEKEEKQHCFGRVMMRLRTTNPEAESRMRSRQKQAKSGGIEEFKDDDAVAMAVMDLLPNNATDEEVSKFLIELPEDDEAFWDNLRSSTKDLVAQAVKASIQRAPEIMRALDKGLAGIVRSIREPLGEALARRGIF